MAFFKFRAHGQKGDEQPVSPAETIDGMRRRARHRLIGAGLLVLLGVLGFPLLFDTQPRPTQVDIPIEIPDKTKVKPPVASGNGVGGKVSEAPPAALATTPATTASPSAAATAPTAAAGLGKVPAHASLDAKEEVMASKPAASPKVEARAEPKVEPKADAKAAAKSEDGAKARALLDGKEAAADVQARFVVQVGAFADADKAREARMKVERAGLKTYTQVVETKDGKRIRVRVGPYAQKAEADKVASKIKSLDLPASILSL